jgi:hypothetical protein
MFYVSLFSLTGRRYLVDGKPITTFQSLEEAEMFVAGHPAELIVYLGENPLLEN